jgi:photosystem II stability/assembly factor-like uncharacterized protein
MNGMRANEVVRSTTGAVLVAVIALVSACGSSETTPTPPPPSIGQATIGAAGGKVQGPDGVQLLVPAGALPADTTIRIARSSSGAPALPEEVRSSATVYEITPHGLRFEQAVTVRLPITGTPGADTTVLVAEPGGTWDSAAPAVESGYLAIKRHSLSWYTHTPLSPTECTPRAGDPFSCVFPTLRPEGDVTVTPPEAWPAPRGLSPTLVQPASITWPMTVTAPRDCGDVTLTVSRRVVPPGTPVTTVIPYQQVDQRSIGLTPMSGNAQRSSATVSYTAVVAAGDNHAVGLRFVFSCRRLFNSSQYNALLEAGYRAEVPAQPGTPTITQQPASIAVVEGNRAEFRVVASAPNTLAINWQRSDDAGATWTTVQTSGDSYALAPARLADNGARFRAQVCNGLGVALNCVFSDAATLTVTPAAVAPVFTAQPQSLSVVEGQTASFSAVATATPTPTVRWFREAASGPATQVGPTCTGTAGQTSCTYTTSAATLGDSGARFFAIATNGTDNTTSAVATLTVTPAAVAPSIPSGQPADVAVTVGESATFSVNATGTAPLSYQWQRDGSDIMGANAASYTLANAQLADSGARFRVRVTNGAGNPTSREATLTVTAPPPPAPGGTCTTGNPASWCWVQPGPHSNALSALAFDGTTVHAVGPRTSMRSSDAGATWQTTFNSIDVNWRDLVSPAGGVLVAATHPGWVGLQSGIFRSTDGGQSWTNTLPFPASVNSLAFGSASNGVAVGDTGRITIWRTTDGGLNWTEVASPSTLVNRLVAVDPATYLAVGSTGQIVRSVDSGQTWSTVASSTSDDLVDVAFANGSLGVAVTGLGAVLRTTDGGASWSAPVAVAAFGGLQTVAFADANTVVAMGAGGRVYRSIDAGLTWTAGEDLNFAGAEYLPRLKFRSASEGYAVGLYGQVWRTTDAGQSWSLVAGGSDLESFTSVKFRGSEGLAASGIGVFRTQDGGATWDNLGGGAAYDIALLDTSVRVAVGFGIRRTSDRGQNWTAVHTTAPSQVLLAVDFVPATGTATTGVAVGNSAGNGLMLRTTDGGISWSPVSIGTVPALYAVTFSASNPGLGLAGGSNRTLLRTTDGGANWSPVTLSALNPTETVQAIRFASTGAIIAADRGLYRSTDGGFSWTRVYDSTGRGGMADVTFLSPTDAVAVGVSGTIVRSADAGATWTAVDVPITANLSGVAYTGNGSEVVAVGDAGTILRNTQGGAP